MSKDQKASEKKEWRKSSGLESVILSVTELGKVCTKAMANKNETEQKHEVYPCWVCSNNISGGSSVGCQDCHAWAHVKCVNLPDSFIGHMNKGNDINITAHCGSCKSNKHQNKVMKEIRELKQKMETQEDATQKLFATQRDFIHKLTGNIDNLKKRDEADDNRDKTNKR